MGTLCIVYKAFKGRSISARLQPELARGLFERGADEHASAIAAVLRATGGHRTAVAGRGRVAPIRVAPGLECVQVPEHRGPNLLPVFRALGPSHGSSAPRRGSGQVEQ